MTELANVRSALEELLHDVPRITCELGDDHANARSGGSGQRRRVRVDQRDDAVVPQVDGRPRQLWHRRDA